ncbi:MAG: aspartate/glutamate racemase family protein [Ruminococcaceae bacterium]|nr:aspartate/glutamate racemase family protein [Oscillospiraceae bacterium]
MTKKAPLLGILGGLGPMSTVYFCELLISHTKAESDADHIDMLISSRATTPDRTAFILGKSDRDPLPVMKEEALRLFKAGVDRIVIPCNTAHYFYDGLCQDLPVPLINIIEETVLHLKRRGITTFGLLATEGTVKSQAYKKICQRNGISCITPSEEQQARVSAIIYEQIKQNRPADTEALLAISRDLLERGCEAIVLGCTELSLLKPTLSDKLPFVDSLEILAYQTILACGKTPIGFPDEFEEETEP